jgi:hypothetical protein
MRLFIASILMCACVLSSACEARIMLPEDYRVFDRISLNPEEVDIDAKSDFFTVHIGNNIYVETKNIYKDEKGLYTFESEFTLSYINECSYEKKWKCPYCHNLYPIGQACTKPDCPSKYK